MRSHLMFGYQKLFFQLAKGPKFRRVGLLLDGPGHAGCRLLSNPHRQPVGMITSTAWSPTLKCRIAQAYVRPEYAKSNKHVPWLKRPTMSHLFNISLILLASLRHSELRSWSLSLTTCPPRRCARTRSAIGSAVAPCAPPIVVLWPPVWRLYPSSPIATQNLSGNAGPRRACRPLSLPQRWRNWHANGVDRRIKSSKSPMPTPPVDTKATSWSSEKHEKSMESRVLA